MMHADCENDRQKIKCRPACVVLGKCGMSTPETPYDRIGGDAGVESLVLAFYARVLADPELAPFFKHTTFSKLYDMQKEFFSMALGGEVQYSGVSLAHAHHGRGINAGHLGRFASHLLETLREQGLSQEEAQVVIDRINSHANEITGTAY